MVEPGGKRIYHLGVSAPVQTVEISKKSFLAVFSHPNTGCLAPDVPEKIRSKNMARYEEISINTSGKDGEEAEKNARSKKHYCQNCHTELEFSYLVTL